MPKIPNDITSRYVSKVPGRVKVAPARLTNRGPAGLYGKLNGQSSVKKPTNDPVEWRKDFIVDALASMACSIGEVSQDPRNARIHPEMNLLAIMESLHAYGQRKPVVANRRTGHIQAGNGTHEAALRMGWTTLAVAWVDDDEATAAGYGLADNRTAELAKWDFKVVAQLDSLVRELGGQGAGIGWTDDELTVIRKELEPAAVEAPSDFPEVDEGIEVEHQCPKCGYFFSGGDLRGAMPREELEVEVLRLRKQVANLEDRIACQSELLSKRAEKEGVR